MESLVPQGVGPHFVLRLPYHPLFRVLEGVQRVQTILFIHGVPGKNRFLMWSPPPAFLAFRDGLEEGWCCYRWQTVNVVQIPRLFECQKDLTRGREVFGCFQTFLGLTRRLYLCQCRWVRAPDLTEVIPYSTVYGPPQM